MNLRDKEKQKEIEFNNIQIKDLKKKISEYENKKIKILNCMNESRNDITTLNKNNEELIKNNVKEFTLEEMGDFNEYEKNEDGKRYLLLHLHRDFVKKYINLGELGYYLETRILTKSKRGITDIACPFCDNGLLELIKVKKEPICSDIFLNREEYSYKFTCSEKCYENSNTQFLILYRQ